MEGISGLYRKAIGETPIPRDLGKVVSVESEGGYRMVAVSVANELHPLVNEDAYFMEPKHGAMGVFDGMGGLPNANLTSAVARDYWQVAVSKLPEDLTLEQTTAELVRIMLKANEAVKADGRVEGGGTTASIVFPWKGPDGQMKIIGLNVGDSRIYHWQKAARKLRTVTIDDNGIRRYTNSEEEARRLQAKLDNYTRQTYLIGSEMKAYMERSKLTQCLGRDETIDPQVHIFDVSSGDVVFALSDGVSGNQLGSTMSQRVASSGDAHYIAKNLVYYSFLNAHEYVNNKAKQNSKLYKVVNKIHPAKPKLNKRPPHPDDMTVVALDIP